MTWMSRSYNRIELLGNLTRDPELRLTASGRSVCGFGLATNRNVKLASGGRREETAYHRVIAWGPLAEQCHHLLKKGVPVFVAGRLSYRTYTKDDEQREVAEVVIDEMIVLEKRRGAATDVTSEVPADASADTAADTANSEGEEAGEEIPFV